MTTWDELRGALVRLHDMPPPSEPPERPAPLDPAQAEAELDGPAVVRSGHTLDHMLLVRDRSGAGLAIAGVQATLSLLANADAPLSREQVRRRTPVLPLTITA